MAEREACLVVPAAYWFEIHGGSPDPDLEHLEYKLRCRIIVEGSAILLANILEFADSSSQFRKLTAERLEKIPKHSLPLAFATLCIVALAQGAWAAGATEQVKSAIDRVLVTVGNPALRGDEKIVERRAAMRKIADGIVDFDEIARRSLGRYWLPLSEVQRKEFVGLFEDLLERSYIPKIELYGGEKIIYGGERVDGDLATVSTKIITKNSNAVPIDYRLLKHGERWMIYDISIEGISLVSNYRTQFNKIIQTSGYDGLVEKMKSKRSQFAEEDRQKRKGD